ncbi:RNA chaperone Hfq [Caballeronia sp. AZ10_KS36]|uniref:RNA chaperone Hfq n=1 Tax=Caballeronia sp. AZ10_KS36 TaxID=2921757 RepID=UPI002027940B|nr:RNA chaperone Hfq [Caballeronia sp. AZ10_KS36]
MQRDDHDVQAAFLESIIGEQRTVWVYLINGVKLSGYIESFDEYALSMRSAFGMQVIYKSGVSTVREAQEVALPMDDSPSLRTVERGERRRLKP